MRVLHWVAVLLFMLAPPVIYFTQERIEPRYFALGLVVLFSIRVLPALTQKNDSSVFVIWSVTMLLVLTTIALSDSTTLLLLYPAVMNVGFLVLFLYSLIIPPTVIERIARMQEPDLPESGVLYTRKVTVIWCVFFVLNGMIAGWTVLTGNRALWAVYNGLIAYLLMGVLMISEYLIRTKIRQTINNEPH